MSGRRQPPCRQRSLHCGSGGGLAGGSTRLGDVERSSANDGDGNAAAATHLRVDAFALGVDGRAHGGRRLDVGDLPVSRRYTWVGASRRRGGGGRSVAVVVAVAVAAAAAAVISSRGGWAGGQSRSATYHRLAGEAGRSGAPGDGSHRQGERKDHGAHRSQEEEGGEGGGVVLISSGVSSSSSVQLHASGLIRSMHERPHCRVFELTTRSHVTSMWAS